jgi:farnesyl diphosphate synthase
MSTIVGSPWMAQRLERVEAALNAFLPSEATQPAALHQAMRYATLDGGKRVRPLLVYAAGEAFGAPDAALDAVACAVECIHAYSLVHDDLPCMDNDVLRRGKPTVHVVYGEAAAMLVGDALQASAFASVARLGALGVAASDSLKIIARLAAASGSEGMVGGQAIDVSSTGIALDRATLEAMHRMKTGALLSASVMMGAACAPASVPFEAALGRYAKAIGLAFQVVDDILDVTADSATLGKTAGKDAAQDKPTYVSLLGLEGAKALAENLLEQAHAALAEMTSVDAERHERLAALADWIGRRAY